MSEKTYTVKLTDDEIFTAYFHLMKAASMYEQRAKEAVECAHAENVRYWKGEARKATDLAEKLQALSHPDP